MIKGTSTYEVRANDSEQVIRCNCEMAERGDKSEKTREILERLAISPEILLLHETSLCAVEWLSINASVETSNRPQRILVDVPSAQVSGIVEWAIRNG